MKLLEKLYVYHGFFTLCIILISTMSGEEITNNQPSPTNRPSFPLTHDSSLTDRIYGIFQIQDVSVIEEIAESDLLE